MSGAAGGAARGRPLGLVVDDHDDARDIACRVLQSLGMLTIEASNGHDALDRARQHLPDLLILDLALPGIDGWTVAQRLKQDPATADLCILGFTAHAEAAFLERARDAGCDALLTKPCLPREFADCVRALLERRTVGEKDLQDG